MLYLAFSEYERIASKAVLEPYPKQFQALSPGSEKIMKCHPGQIWRPIDWCDNCKQDLRLQGHVAFDPDTRKALCYRCAEVKDDRAAASALGIDWDG
jgi:hypothetical protein